VSPDYKQAARDQGGRRFMLRVHDSTNLDIDYQQPHATQEYICNENDFDKHINIPVSNRDYIVEVGYYTPEKRWIRIIRSFHVRVPAN
jgi:phosphate transport system substrate-binding protein